MTFLKNETVEDAEAVLFAKNKRKIRARIHADQILLKNRKYIYVSAEDITEKRTIEEERQTLSLFAKYSSNAAIIANQQGLINWVNPSFLEKRGYNFEEVKDRPYYDLFLENNISREIKNTFQKKANYKNEAAAKTRNNRFLWITFEIIVIHENLNKESNFIIIENDITKEKVAEQKLISFNNLHKKLLHIASTYINLSLTHVSRYTDRALSDMAKFVGAERAYIYHYDFNKQQAINTNKWVNKESISSIILESIPLEFLSVLRKAHKEKGRLYIQDTRDFQNGDFKDFLDGMSIKTIICLPLRCDAQDIGFVGFDILTKQQVITDDEIETLRFFSELISNIKVRIKTEAQLESTRQRLTTIIDNAPVLDQYIRGWKMYLVEQTL
ncbi:MAG: PAS domain-containing protein [Bacteroidota bacterium]|nr:PAS domain-containing protein [Bacteroidota bacterium]